MISIGPSTPCNHEEADTRIVIHVLHALSSREAKSVVVRTVDSDVVVILIGKFYDIQHQYPETDIWVAFGMGHHFNFLSINATCACIGETKSKSLPLFHALTGCDTTSCFYGKSKQST